MFLRRCRLREAQNTAIESSHERLLALMSGRLCRCLVSVHPESSLEEVESYYCSHCLQYLAEAEATISANRSVRRRFSDSKGRKASDPRWPQLSHTDRLVAAYDKCA
jgi:hypothetical protein